MNFDTFDTHQWPLLRLLIMLLMVVGALLVAAIVGSYRRLRNKRITDAGAQADVAAAAPGHAKDVVRLEKSVAARRKHAAAVGPRRASVRSACCLNRSDLPGILTRSLRVLVQNLTPI